MHYASSIFFGLCSLLSVTVTPIVHANPVQAGYVQEMVGSQSNYSLQHLGNKRQLKLLDIIYAGDKIYIDEPLIIDIELTISLDGKPIILDNDESPYTVPTPKGATSIAENLLNMLKKSITVMHQKYVATVAMASRGSKKKNTADLAFSKLFLHHGTLHASEFKLAIEWAGGKPPYQLKLLQGKKVMDESNSKKRSITLKKQAYAIGSYTVQIQDSAKASITSNFQVVKVAPPEMPCQLKTELQASQLSSEMKTALRMAWLIQEHPQWKREAYQQLCPAKKEHVAKVLCASLLSGR